LNACTDVQFFSVAIATAWTLIFQHAVFESPFLQKPDSAFAIQVPPHARDVSWVDGKGCRSGRLNG